MKALWLLFTIGTAFTAYGQQHRQRMQKEVYVSYGRHLRTNYSTTGGEATLITKRNAFAAQAGLNITKNISQKFFWQTGVAVHLMFLDETAYGVTGKIPAAAQNFRTWQPNFGTEYIESTTVGIPLKLGFQKRLSPK